MKIKIITPTTPEYYRYLPELMININAHILCDFEWCIGVENIDDALHDITLHSVTNDNNVSLIEVGYTAGIFAAKKKIIETLAEGDVVTFIDADDYYINTIDDNLQINADVVYCAAELQRDKLADVRQPYTWRYITRAGVLMNAYKLIEQWSGGYKYPYINSCEDILLTTALIEVITTFQHVTQEFVAHTENATSVTNSKQYTERKIKTLWGDWPRLCAIQKASKSEYLRMIMQQCVDAYKYNHRQWLPIADRDICDKIVADYEKQII